MLSYKVAYRMQMGTFLAQVVDFPEVSAFGSSLSEARANLSHALRYVAERRLRRGELLPIPDPHTPVSDAYLVEAFTVMPRTEDQVEIQVRC